MPGPPPLGSTNASSLDEPQVQYTFNSKVMVAAMVILFIVVLFVVSLHIYAKWFWRQGTAASRWSATNALNASWHRRRRRLELVADESAAANASTGLDPSTVNSLPTFIYEGAVHEAEPLLECAVCLSEFQAHEKGRILPNCKHSFHIDCIDMWFHSHSTCPLCRTPISLPMAQGQHAGNLSNHPPPLFQHITLSSTAHQRHSDEQNTSATVSADAREPLPLIQSVPGLELHPQQEDGPANNPGHKAPMFHSLIPMASMSTCPHIPSYGELLYCKDDIAHASLPRMGASGSSSARAMPTDILRQQERVAIARSTSLSLSRVLSEDVQVCSRQPQKSSSFRMSIKRLVSRELSKGRSRVFPSGQMNAESEQSTSAMNNSPV